MNEIKSKIEEISSLEVQLQTTQQQLIKVNSELSSLGIFAFSTKRELNARVKELSDSATMISNKISQARAFINNAGSVEALQSSIDNNERKVFECLNSVKFLNDELESLKTQLNSIIQKMKNHQIIFTLAQNIEVLSLMIEDPSLLSLIINDNNIIMMIQASDELRYMLKTSKIIYLIPKDVQKRIFGSSSFDVEAAYYQACQAMEEARCMDDIIWARGEFEAIKFYKDSAQRFIKCERMIASNTYKYK